MIKNETEFYEILLREIETIIGDKKNDFSGLSEISRATYYNLKNISEGDNNTPRLSISKIKKVCKELNVPYEKIHYEINDSYKNKPSK